MLVVHISVGIILGSTLFTGIFYLGYKTGRAVYKEL